MVKKNPYEEVYPKELKDSAIKDRISLIKIATELRRNAKFNSVDKITLQHTEDGYRVGVLLDADSNVNDVRNAHNCYNRCARYLFGKIPCCVDVENNEMMFDIMYRAPGVYTVMDKSEDSLKNSNENLFNIGDYTSMRRRQKRLDDIFEENDSLESIEGAVDDKKKYNVSKNYSDDKSLKWIAIGTIITGLTLCALAGMWVSGKMKNEVDRYYYRTPTYRGFDLPK